MNRTIDRTRGVTLRVLDINRVAAEASKQLDRTLRTSFEPYAMAEHDGHLYVVCNEGVGWEVTDKDPLYLDLYAHSENGISIFPTCQAKLSPAEVRELATDQEIDLADLIRTFGSRLESNFWSLHELLSA